MALKDQELLTNAHLLRGVAAGVVGFVLAGALARLVSGDRTIYKLAGLAGGVLGGSSPSRYCRSPARRAR